MTDQELLQAMGQMLQESEARMRTMMKEEIQESEARMKVAMKGEVQESEARMKAAMKDEVQESEKRIMKNAAILMDADFGPRFNALSEQIDLILEKLPDPEEMEMMDHRVSALELSVKKLNKEVKQLKAANS